MIPVRNSQGEKVAAYIMLFVCAVSRAVRLELVTNLSTNELLLAMRRFYNRNPTVKCFFSDNAAAFKRAAKEVKLLFDQERSAKTRSFLSKHRITSGIKHGAESVEEWLCGANGESDQRSAEANRREKHVVVQRVGDGVDEHRKNRK